MILDAELPARALQHAETFLTGLPECPVGPPPDIGALRAAPATILAVSRST